MNTESKRREIEALILNIKNHSDRLSEGPSISLLELNVILSKINRLHETTVVLKYLIAKKQHFEDTEFEVPELNAQSKMAFEETITKDDQDVAVETAVKNDLEIEEEIIVEMDVVEEEDLGTDEEIIVEMDVVEEEDLGADEEIIVEMDVLEDDETAMVEKDTEAEFNEKAIEQVEIDQEENRAEESIIETDSSVFAESLEQEFEKIKGDVLGQQDLNEQYADQVEKRIEDQLQNQPIDSISEAIGLNERYLYANELFEGEMEDFLNAVNSLDEVESLEQGQTFFNNELIAKRNWEANHEMVLALQGLLERRFS